MKKLLLASLLFILSVNAFSQVVISSDTAWFNGFPKDGFVHSLKDTITNNTASPVTITWNKTSDALLSGWTGIGLCDPDACYPYNGSPHSVTLAAGASGAWYVDMNAATTAADGTSYITITTNYGDMTFAYKTWPTAIKDVDNANLVTIYPNPATNFISFNLNDKRIASISILNVIGKKLAKMEVNPSNNSKLSFSLENIPNGVYIVQLNDTKGKLLGVRRVTKQ